MSLLAAAHQDDAFDGVIVILLLGLETENAEARGVADFDTANILYADGNAIQAGNDDFANIFRSLDQAEAADVVKLAALGIEAATGVGIVGVQSGNDLHHGKVIVVELYGSRRT